MLKRGDIGLLPEIMVNSIYWQLDLSVFGTPSNLGLSIQHITIDFCAPSNNPHTEFLCLKP